MYKWSPGSPEFKLFKKMTKFGIKTAELGVKTAKFGITYRFSIPPVVTIKT